MLKVDFEVRFCQLLLRNDSSGFFPLFCQQDKNTKNMKNKDNTKNTENEENTENMEN